MKRATILFVRPGVGRTIMQEHEGKVDQALRKGIEAARRTFLKVYLPLREEADAKRIARKVRK